jgi:hypothetical protein
MDAKAFTTPVRKLAQFFERSRDGWKAKCQEAKTACKKLSNQVRAVEKSREHWKELARQQERELRELKKQASADKNAIDGTCAAATGGARGN